MPKLPRTTMLLLCLSVSGALCFYFTQNETAAEPERAERMEVLPIARTTFELVVRENGILKPIQVTTIGFTQRGIIDWLIPEGTRVEKGEKLVSISTEELQEDLQRVQEELTVSETNLAQFEQELEVERKTVKDELGTEQDRVELARLKRKEILAKPTELDLAQSRNAYESSASRVKITQLDYQTIAPLAEAGYIVRNELEAKRLDWELAQNEANRLQMQLTLTEQGARQIERQRTELELQLAETLYAKKDLDTRRKLREAEQKVRRARFEVERNGNRLKQREQRLSECVRYAPHGGIVTHRRIEWRNNKKIAVGDQVNQWIPPIDLPSYERMKVRTQVPESTVRSLLARRATSENGEKHIPGTQVKVRIQTVKNRIFSGEVLWVDGWARDRNAKLTTADLKVQGLSGVRVFDVEVELQESDPDLLREGFQAAVDFPLQVLQDVIVVPRHAVSTRDERFFVRVQRGSTEISRTVTLGPECLGQVVITSGLEVGERILVPPAPVGEGS